jgi:hypothetical protein
LEISAEGKKWKADKLKKVPRRAEMSTQTNEDRKFAEIACQTDFDEIALKTKQEETVERLDVFREEYSRKFDSVSKEISEMRENFQQMKLEKADVSQTVSF